MQTHEYWQWGFCFFFWFLFSFYLFDSKKPEGSHARQRFFSGFTDLPESGSICWQWAWGGLRLVLSVCLSQQTWVFANSDFIFPFFRVFVNCFVLWGKKSDLLVDRTPRTLLDRIPLWSVSGPGACWRCLLCGLASLGYELPTILGLWISNNQSCLTSESNKNPRVSSQKNQGSSPFKLPVWVHRGCKHVSSWQEDAMMSWSWRLGSS